MERTICADAARETPLASDVTESHSDRNTTNAEFAVVTDLLVTNYVHTTDVTIVLSLKDVHGALAQRLTEQQPVEDVFN